MGLRRTEDFNKMREEDLRVVSPRTGIVDKFPGYRAKTKVDRYCSKCNKELLDFHPRVKLQPMLGSPKNPIAKEDPFYVCEECLRTKWHLFLTAEEYHHAATVMEKYFPETLSISSLRKFFK